MSETKQTSKIKSAGNMAGWCISVLSGIFTLFEILVPKGYDFSNLGLSADLVYLENLLGIWYVRYSIVAVFVGLLLFFVFPREEERVKRRRRRNTRSKKN